MNLAAADRDSGLATIAVQEQEVPVRRAPVAARPAPVAPRTARWGQHSPHRLPPAGA